MSMVFDHPWLGGLFDDADAEAIWSPDRQISHMLAFEAAFSSALGYIGSVPVAIADALEDQIAGFTVDVAELRNGSARDGLPVPALVSQLRAMAKDNSSAVHTGVTSQDVLDTALAVTLRDFNALLHLRLAELIAAIDELKGRFAAQPLMGRTRMQAALPITVGDRLRTWSHPLRAQLERLDHARLRVENLQLGGAVGDRAKLSPHIMAIAACMAKQLGLNDPGSSWHTMRDGLADYASLLSLITGSVGKIGQDICLMAQQGIDEIGFVGGGSSSAMPHKQNPVLAELLVTLARFNGIQISGMHHALIHEQERSGAAWMLEWMILPEMAKTTARSLSAAHELCAQIQRIGPKNPE